MTPTGGRLLLVVPTATSFLTFLTTVAEEWRRRGGEVAVATGPDLPGHAADGGGNRWPEGVDRLPLPGFRMGSPPALIRAAGRLRRHIGEWRPDMVHAHFAAAVFLAAMVRTSMGRRPPVWIGTFHGLHTSTFAAAAERWAARRMTQVCVLNAEDRESLDRGNVRVPVHLHRSCGVGCDLARFDAGRFSVADRLATRRAAGLSPDAFVLVFVGRQTAFKGFAAAVRGYQSLREAGIDAALVIVGAADSLHSTGLTARELHLLDDDPHVVRAGWQHDVSPWLAIADACVLPSVREGMPVSLMESLAMGVPVITVDSRGCRSVVRDGVDGFVLPCPAPEGIARAAARLAADRPLRESMRAAAVAGRDRFDRRLHALEQADLYATLARIAAASRAERPSPSPAPLPTQARP